MAKEQQVKVGKAKGRPMLTWVGKQPLTRVRAYPAQHVESFSAGEVNDTAVDWSDWPDRFERGGLLFHGDNKDVLAYLLANGFRGKVKLIYLDPPFDSGADYVRKVELRGVAGVHKLEGEEYELGEQIQYSDIWSNDNYLQFVYERLLMLRMLLSEGGSLWLHCDWHKNHLLRCILDEVFGAESLQNEVVWQRTDPHNDAVQRLGWIHDTLYWYAPHGKPNYNSFDVATELSPAALREYSLAKSPGGEVIRWNQDLASDYRRFKLDDCTYKGSDPKRRFRWRGAVPSNKRVWPYKSPEEMDEAVRRGEFFLRDPDKGAARCRVSYLDERNGQLLQTIWTDTGRMKGGVRYPTEKPESLLERIVRACTQPNDLVLDCFVGSGTTVAVAQKLGRRWIGADINKGAIQTTAKRLQKIMREQETGLSEQKQGELVESEDASALPCQLGFTTWRVNDYDLQIQHNEAVELACEFIGVTRTRTDSFFEGTRGKRLVKVIPFNHPLTPLDLESVKEELGRRPEEERDVELVALGMELTARSWLETYNRNRPLNRFHLIELRTDAKYGGFLKHEPLTAAVTVRRKGDTVEVDINDVYSPSIVKRLNMEQGLFRAQIDDWRAVVDCVLIDTSYDGEVFNVAHTDLPEKKVDLVEGHYALPAPPQGSTVAVKIIDMLGEELIVTEQV